MTTHFTARAVLAAAALIAPHLAHAAVSAVDDAGQTVTLAQPARRIVSLAPHVTELIYAAGGGDRIVGTVSYSDFPPEARDLPRVGDNKALDLERIAALKPDLIVVWRHGNAQKQTDRLRALGMPLFFSEPRKLESIPENLEKLGTLMGTEAVATRAATDFRQQVETLRKTYASRAPVTVFYQVWQQPLMTLNGQHLVSDLLALCGGRNLFANETPLVPTVSVEAVIAGNPEAMLTAGIGATRPDKPLADFSMWEKWKQVTAVARNNLFIIDGDLVNRAGPRVVKGAAEICKDLEIARSRRTGRPG
ncbi:iron complex transport system substrate-binding protein [Cupriavidus sp. YR651]|uniref:cobalamin-binding protein n=1 Tax=Cupriavidus sp. YR651 TaxID=1855315 RepID=UPI000889EEB9|nr:cobalamin-binding protein [Cupriavidus sp. YR651]SDC23777.1 iron complex transport system substrate-binding protein [Cupriavidus sp. YR651]